MGAPKGNKNATKNRPWADAIRKALAQYEDGDVKRGQALGRIAKKVIEQALAGSKEAYTEIGNRMDGKPHQSHGVAGPDGEPVPLTMVVEYVRSAQSEVSGETSDSEPSEPV